MDVPLSILILLCIIFLVIGAVLMLILQYYVYLKFSLLPQETEEQRDINVKYTLPTALRQSARNATNSSTPKAPGGGDGGGEGEEAGSLDSVNFVMQFLFHELRNSNRVRKWFYRKLSVELDELIAKTTTGKLFDKLTIKELELGDQFPEIKTLRVHNVLLDESETRIENLDLLLLINYTGNFCTTIDADMVLGKKGSLTLKVKQLSGMARLQFTRNPYTHWSLSFLGDPEINLAIESKYQGRQMQSQVTSLISNQIRKAVRRKHTLPNYKLRYKPFFHKTAEDEAGDGDIQPNGFVEIKVSELSRLMCPVHVTDIYCSLTVASLAFVEARQRDDRNVIVSLDVEIHKAKNQQIGIFFKQSSEQVVEIEAVLPNTPACKSNLRVGDVLLAIEGRRVNSIQQVAKVVKGLSNPVFRLRIERVIPGIIRNDAILEDLELYEDFGDRQAGYGTAKSLEPETAAKSRTSSAERGGTSSESSLNSTPTNSPKKSKLIAKALKKTISRDNSERDELKTKIKLPIKGEDNKLRAPSKSPAHSASEGVNDVEHYYQHSTIDCPVSRFIQMEDLSNFKLSGHCRFLNVCVYGKCQGDSLLLGFVNIPIQQILTECCETSLSQYWKKFDLNPPIPQDLKTHCLSSQSGFNPNLCFGDILLAFTWHGNPNLTVTETPSKQQAGGKLKISSTLEKSLSDDSAFDTVSIKSTSSDASVSVVSMPRAHNFIRTHFQRATQCDFCGKKIWLKDAVQCRECLMCCHKKCVNKCQMATVCGPVECSIALQPATPAQGNVAPTPEFTVTEPAKAVEAMEGDDISAAGSSTSIADDEMLQPKIPTGANLEVHRSSLTGLLAQGIKRVNSANNLAIPGIVSSLAAGVSGGNASGATGGLSPSTKSLPPSPQNSPMRKSSIAGSLASPFDVATQRLAALPADLTALTAEQVASITEPIVAIAKEEDVMSAAKMASKTLYANMNDPERVEHINQLVTKLRLALVSEMAVDGAAKGDAALADKSEERMQALSVIMLYLCTGLQHAHGGSGGAAGGSGGGGGDGGGGGGGGAA